MFICRAFGGVLACPANENARQCVRSLSGILATIVQIISGAAAELEASLLKANNTHDKYTDSQCLRIAV